MITDAEVRLAAARIHGKVRRTPVFFAGPAWFKCEFMQHTGSFKTRGAFNRLLAAHESGELDPAAGIVIASGGNAGLANAYAAAQIGVTATAFVPETSPAFKVAKLRAFGANVIQHGREYAEAFAGAAEHAAATGAILSHAYDQADIVAGAGTVATELLDQTDRAVDTVIVAVGGGGLMAGVAAAVAGTARVVGVEPESIPTLHTALAKGGPVDIPVSGVAMDSLGARRVGDIAYAVAAKAGVQSVLVSDADLVRARRELWENWRIVAEHGAAAPLAALITKAYRPEPGERVALIVCGANTDPSDL